MALSINHYLNNMALLTNQWNVHNYRRLDRQRIYLKDIDCPQVWHDKLKEQIPPAVFYINESTGDIGGLGSVFEPSSHGPIKKGRGVARAGDLMSCLPVAMRADNLMCYIGHEGTYTPAHREMCASLGQNIMVEASGLVDEDGKASKPGSSIWFMTETKDRHLVSEYWLSTLGHDIEVEAHFAQINAWKAAPFTTYIVEQKVGDFILIPPLAPHQVWNRGTRTMKVAWNRTTVETLEMALHEALPRARMVCRDEQYKNKAIILFALQRYSALLEQVHSQRKTGTDTTKHEISNSTKIRQLQKDFKRLYKLYTEILLSEMLAPIGPTEKTGQYVPYDSNITCSYCRANIFNRFLTCTSCIIALEDGEEDTYDICMDCYAMGRSCRCISRLKWVEQFPWKDLVDKHELWRHQIIEMEGTLDENSPQSLQFERKRLSKKTLAQVCQEQLKLRPWRDPKKPDVPQVEEKDSEDEVNNDGSVKKKQKKRRSEKWLRENITCHICKHRDPLWKLAVCECGMAYCYGSLWRAFDMTPQSIMEDPKWKCPRCQKICSCAGCRKDPQMRPFEPNGTVLGHNTKKFADPRSVESLVDFSSSNIEWVKKAGDDHPHETRRLRRRQDEAESAKSKDAALDDNYVDEESMPSSRTRSIADLEVDPNIDPQLAVQSPRYEKRQMPTVAQQALAAMNGLTTLEKDPEGFRLLANAESLRNPAPFAAPLAQMIDQTRVADSTKVAANGITYEYPDPTIPNGLATRTGDSHPPSDFPRNEPAIKGQKRKRVSDAVGVQYNLPPPPKNTANSQYVEAQKKQAMAKAQKNDRRISAEAAISGKQLLLKLPVDISRLNGFSPINEQRISSEMDSLDQENEISAPLLQSDLPADPLMNEIVTPRSEPPKRRSIRLETDEDFSMRRSQKRRPSGADRLSGRPKSTTAYVESSEGSEVEGSLETTRENNVDKSQVKGRPLPGYLARRRNPEEIDTPEELPSRPSRKRASNSRQPPVDKSNTTVNSDDRMQKEGSKSQSASDAGAGNFDAKLVPEPNLDIGLKESGSGASSLTASAQSASAQENRRAKMIAMRSVQSDTFMDDSEPDSPQELRESPKKPTKDSRALVNDQSCSNSGRSSKQTPVKQIPHTERKSIFSKPGKKIKVISMTRSAAKSKPGLRNGAFPRK